MKPTDVVYDDGIQRLTVEDVSREFAREATVAGAADDGAPLGEIIQAIDAAGMSLEDVRALTNDDAGVPHQCLSVECARSHEGARWP